MSAVAQIYFLVFWIPAVVSAVTLSMAWSSGILRRPVVASAWFGLALVLQLAAHRFSPAWAVGLVLQVVLAVWLGIRMKLDT